MRTASDLLRTPWLTSWSSKILTVLAGRLPACHSLCQPDHDHDHQCHHQNPLLLPPHNHHRRCRHDYDHCCDQYHGHDHDDMMYYMMIHHSVRYATPHQSIQEAMIGSTVNNFEQLLCTVALGRVKISKSCAVSVVVHHKVRSSCCS